MSVTCEYDSLTRHILADFNGTIIKVNQQILKKIHKSLPKVKVPDGLQSSTVNKIVTAIYGLPITTKSIEIVVSMGKLNLKISYEKPKNTNTDFRNSDSRSDDSGNANDTEVSFY